MDLYGEIILDHYKNPQNFKLIENSDLDGEDNNPLCGDTVHMTAKIDSMEKISEIGFQGQGCAISIAATSILTDELKGKKLSEIEKMDQKDIFEMMGFEVNPGRVKCAMLGLACLKRLIKKYRIEHESQR